VPDRALPASPLSTPECIFRYPSKPYARFELLPRTSGCLRGNGKKRGTTLDLDGFQALDKERRELITATEQLKAKRNKPATKLRG